MKKAILLSILLVIFSAGNENDGYTMRIGEREYPCSFEKDKMIFSWAHVDGEVITFKKLYLL